MVATRLRLAFTVSGNFPTVGEVAAGRVSTTSLASRIGKVYLPVYKKPSLDRNRRCRKPSEYAKVNVHVLGRPTVGVEPLFGLAECTLSEMEKQVRVLKDF